MKRSLALLTALALTLLLATACGGAPEKSDAADFTKLPQSENVQSNAQGGDYRAMWFSYLEWSGLNTADEASFTQGVAAVMQNCKALGLNTIIVQVRPFGDAIYLSKYFPWSHLLTGTQGQAPSYDPLAIFVQQAHEQGLRIEAWINPYRVKMSEATPSQLAQENAAVAHPDWVKEAAGGLYFDPANSEVRQYICDGVEEVLRAYEVDGVQFDDYFYPVTDESFDAEEYSAQGNGMSLGDWRRSNVNALVQQVYEMVQRVEQETGRSLVFGISPQGNNDNNYNTQYSDVALWLSTPGYVDYVMPQVYWGYDFTLQSGSDRFAFENIVSEWMAMPRDAAVQLYFGLGAYRVGAGDESSTPSQEWQSGSNLARMAKTLDEKGAGGYALYRYDSLYRAGEYQALAAAECEALRQYHAQRSA